MSSEETKRIGDVCDLINGRAFKPAEWASSGLPIVRIQNLNSPDSEFNHCDFEVKSKYYIDDGELLFAWSGTPGTSFGAHVWNGGRAVLNQHIYRVVPKPDQDINIHFLCLAINQKVNELIGKAQGGVGLRHVTKGVFEDTEIWLPSWDKQCDVVQRHDELSLLQENISSHVDVIPNLLERFRQSVLASAFRGDLTAEWREQNPGVEPASELLERIRVERKRLWIEDYARNLADRAKARAQKKNESFTDKDWQDYYDKKLKVGEKKYEEPEPVDAEAEGLPELPPTWEWVRLELVVVDGPTNGYSPTCGNDAHGSLVLGLGSTSTGQFVLNETTIKTSYETVPLEKNCWIQDGDILVQRGNTLDFLGISALYTGPSGRYVFPDLMMRIKPSPEVSAYFLDASIKRPMVRSYIRDSATGTAGNMPKISQSVVAKMPIPLPPAEEQIAIENLLRRTLTTATSQEQLVDDLSASLSSLRASVLQRAFQSDEDEEQ